MVTDGRQAGGRWALGPWADTTVATVALGLQALRALLPLLVFGIRDRFGWSAWGAPGSMALAALALSVFAAVWLGGPFRRTLGDRRLFAGSALVCGLAVVAAQVWPGDPLGVLVAVALAVIAFLVHLGVAAAYRRDTVAASGLAGKILAGFLVDGLIHFASGTLDPIWRHDPTALGVTLGLVLVQWLGLRPLGVEARSESEGLGWRWLGVGLWIFLEVVLFHNLARLTALAELEPTTLGALWLLGRWVAWVVVRSVPPPTRRPPAVVPLGATLVATTAIAWPSGTPALLLILAGQLAGGLLLAGLIEGSRRPEGAGTAWNGGASLLLFSTLFLYYGSYDLPLPFANSDVLRVSALALVVLTWVGKRAGAVDDSHQTHRGWTPTPLLALVGIAMAAGLAMGPRVETRAADGPLRIMTYNIHCGFGPKGLLTLEAQARLIEAHAPDVVALQEVSRGWAINGSVDTLEWLARRLGMEAHFAPTADPLWGNAVLTRHPIGESFRAELPRGGKRMGRGLLAVELPGFAPEGRPLWLVATHLHHRSRDGALREAQVESLLETYRAHRDHPTVVLGDLNAPPGTPEMEALAQAGFLDVVTDAGLDPAPTFRSDRLTRRLDYIWISPDLAADDVVVPIDDASDHLAVVATIRPVEP